MHEEYMRQALDLAREAAAAGEVPVGCVIVRDGAVVGRGRNRREERQAAWSHAEMEAMAEANRTLGTWRLDGCTIAVTLEPCPMCAGAIAAARLRRLVFGAWNPDYGAAGSLFDVLRDPRLPHRVEVVGGVLEDECGAVLRGFFADRRDPEGVTGGP